MQTHGMAINENILKRIVTARREVDTKKKHNKYEYRDTDGLAIRAGLGNATKSGQKQREDYETVRV